MSNPIQYVQVPVPQHLVSAVMAFITNAEDTRPPTQVWSERELRKVWTESAQNMRRTLVFLATNSGRQVSGETLASEALGLEEKGHSIAGMMGAFNRRMKGRHKGKSPLSAAYDAEAREWRYTMAPEIGHVILRLAAE